MKDKTNKLYNIDNIEFLKTLPDNSISSCISDVPYALCDIDALKMIKEDMQNKSDFMGRKWFLPSIEFLKECNRVLKDGGFFITTFSPRQDLQCVFSYRLLEAGFDINFTPILWCFQTGFPKAADFSKMADRRAKAEREVVETQKRSGKGFNKTKGFGYIVPDGVSNSQELYSQNIDITKPTTPEAKYLDGLKSLQLKPAYEVVIIAQKPYKAKSKIDQALVWYNERKELLDKGIKEEDLYLYTKNASGGVRIDKNDMFDGAMSSRIPTESDKDENSQARPNCIGKQYGGNNDGAFLNEMAKNQGCNKQPLTQGRFPATILAGSPIDFCEEQLLQAHELMKSL